MDSLVINFASIVFGAGAVYGAIRGDLRRLHEKAADLHEAVRRAHDRIDNLLERSKP